MNLDKIKEKELEITQFNDILKRIELLKTSASDEEKVNYMESLKQSHRKELKIKRNKIFYTKNTNIDLNVLEENLKTYITKLSQGKNHWWLSDNNQLALTLATYFGFILTFAGLAFTYSQVNTVNKELNIQWDSVNKNNLKERYNNLLEQSKYMGVFVTTSEMESLLSYINESDAYLRKNQRKKYKKFYKTKFENSLINAKSSYRYITLITKEEFINCLKDMQLQLKE